MNAFFSSRAGCVVRWLDLPGDGVPLVFVHGLGCAASYEYPRVVCDKHFHGRRAILIDLPGYGYSEKPQDYSYAISAQAGVVNELIDHLALTRFFLYGHSMGGSIAIEAAQQAGDALCGLMVSEPNLRPGGGFFSLQIARQQEAEYIATTHAEIVRNDRSAWAGSLAVAASWAVWRGASSLIAGNTWFEMLTRFDKPTCLIFGEDSLPDSDFSEVEQAGTMTRVLPNCGHSMSWENPSALAAALSDFCALHE